MIFRCFKCKKNFNEDFNKDLIKRFENTYEFCDRDINRLILLLRKGVFHMNTWIAGTDLMKNYCQKKKFFTTAETRKTLQMLIIDMQREYLKILIMKI